MIVRPSQMGAIVEMSLAAVELTLVVLVVVECKLHLLPLGCRHCV